MQNVQEVGEERLNNKMESSLLYPLQAFLPTQQFDNRILIPMPTFTLYETTRSRDIRSQLDDSVNLRQLNCHDPTCDARSAMQHNAERVKKWSEVE